MSDKKAKQHRRKRAQQIKAIFQFSQKTYDEKNRTEPTIKSLLAMSDKKFSAVIAQSAQRLADIQARLDEGERE